MFKQRFPVFYFPLYFLFTRWRHVLRFLLFLFPGIDPICNCLLQGEAYASVSVFALIPFRTRVNPVLFVVTVPASFVDISFFIFLFVYFGFQLFCGRFLHLAPRDARVEGPSGVVSACASPGSSARSHAAGWKSRNGARFLQLFSLRVCSLQLFGFHVLWKGWRVALDIDSGSRNRRVYIIVPV